MSLNKTGVDRNPYGLSVKTVGTRRGQSKKIRRSREMGRAGIGKKEKKTEDGGFERVRQGCGRGGEREEEDTSWVRQGRTGRSRKKSGCFFEKKAACFKVEASEKGAVNGGSSRSQQGMAMGQKKIKVWPGCSLRKLVC